MPLKRNTNKTPFCVPSNKLFLKDGLHDNHWVGHPVMKSIDAVVIQKKATIMKATTLKWILLMKVLEGPKNILYQGKPRR